MKGSSIAAIGGGIAAAIVIAVVLTMSGGISESPQVSENFMGETTETSVTEQVEKIQVLASFYPYYEFTKNVAGDSATVSQYMPSGVEAHDWEPRPQEIKSLQDADVFVYNGLGMEPYIDKMIDSGEFDNVLFVKVSEGVELIKPEEDHDDHDDHGDEHDDHAEEGHDAHAEDFAKEIEHVVEEFEHGHIDSTKALTELEEILGEHEGDGHDHGNETIEKIEAVIHEIEDGHMSAEEGFEEIHHIVLEIKEEDHDDHDDHGDEGGHHHHHHDFEFDPHIWLDPILVKQQVNNIRDALIEADPQNKEQYEQNAMTYNQELDDLDMKFKSSLASCNKDTFVPYHNAFTYLAERYDLKVMALGGLAPRAEATGAEIKEFVDFVRENDVKVIFNEELVDPRLAEIIAEESGAKVMLFSPLEALAPEEVGKNISYIEKMEQNMDSLKVALECQ
ncbi:zinc ABC transporter substrate-binding protein [Nitrosopumilus sp.]|uniref:metal ABC transporter solute-binding protein, Zn/Mn family n=1 Tax=Nitrosopumilus sp. TaxID=2024843 RepID=UPI00261921BF|nr:zinc ABC transporter substrate-binding protein [Nitrosopumilus sp.]